MACGIVVLDQVSKKLVSRMAHPRHTIVLIPDLLGIKLESNPALAFRVLEGLDSTQRFLILVLCPIAVLFALLAILARARLQNPSLKGAIGMVVGGALGNLVDRIALGSVIDFIHLGGRRGPTLNLADLAIIFGIWRLGRLGLAALIRVSE